MRFLTFRHLSLLAALAITPAALAAPAAPPKKAAEEAPPPPESNQPKIGVGLAVMGSTLVPSAGAGGVVAFYVPLDLGKFRIEPWLGLSRSGARGPGGQSSFGLEFGAGGFMLLKPVRTITAYLGGRIGLGIISVSRTDPITGISTSDTGTDIGLLPAAGVEYLPDPHFSIGIEGQLGLIIRTGGGSSAVDFGTNGLAFLRFYM